VTGSRIALDTNQAIAVLNDAGDTGQWVQTFAEVYLPVPVVGELRFGALKSQRVAENLKRVEQLIARCKVLNVTIATAEIYARIRLQLRQKGKPIPENDLWIAAICIEHKLPLATTDTQHFLEVDDLQVIQR
jgi:tRNA(fMet)-specific endonuclease VapC